jgi:hypothetical protein
MFFEFFKRNGFRGINENQRGKKKMWGWEKKFSFIGTQLRSSYSL